jgi:predicted nucleic acid-binding protein
VAVFVDTGAWFAASVPSDRDHAAAAAFMRSNTDRLVTSDYIYDELLTLFRSRGQMDRAKDWVEQVRQRRLDIIEVVESDNSCSDQALLRFCGQGLELHRLHQPRAHGTIRRRAGICVRRAFSAVRHSHCFAVIARHFSRTQPPSSVLSCTQSKPARQAVKGTTIRSTKTTAVRLKRLE